MTAETIAVALSDARGRGAAARAAIRTQSREMRVSLPGAIADRRRRSGYDQEF